MDTNTVASLKQIITSLEQKEAVVGNEIRRLQEFIGRLENSGNSRPLDDRVARMLSRAAKFALNVTRGPLNPDQLADFFLDKVFNKPKPNVLPIVRRYTQDVDGLMKQLSEMRASVITHHKAYMDEQYRLDKLLKSRIYTFLKNIRGELAAERSSNMRQTTITHHYPTRNSQPRPSTSSGSFSE